jgi:hypothetical protein
MRIFSMKRLGIVTAVAAAGVGAAVLPASALGIGIGGSSLLHVQDCRSAAFARQANYDVSFSSKTTGPVKAHVGAMTDGALTLCYSLDVSSLSSVQVSTASDVSVNGVVSGLVNQSDASWVCTNIHLKVAPGVRGTVSATAHAHAVVDGVPTPVEWSNTFAKDVQVSDVGEDIVLQACGDTSGQASVA